MSEKVKIPTVGESIEEVTISAWKKSTNEYVKMDEIIAELESDKATFELAAPRAGVLKILKQEGDTVPVGEIVCEIDDSVSKPKNVQKNNKNKSTLVEVSTPPITGDIKEMRVPEIGESISEVALSSWLKQDGDLVVLDEIIAEVESDKATFELPAEAQGILKISAQEGDTLSIGALICTISIVKEMPNMKKEPAQSSTSSPAPSKQDSYATGHPSPSAKKILDEKGILPSSLSGTGVGGRITKEDATRAQLNTKTATSSSAPSLIGRHREERREKISSLRKTIARRLVSVKNETAMLTTFNEVDMYAIMDLRTRYKEKFKEKYEIGLGFMSFFTKAVCVALKEFPAVNAYIDGTEILYHNYCDISIAVSTPRGLVVPVIRNAELLCMDEIEKEVARLANRGREGKLSIEEMTGGTFSITNGGVFGSMLSTPILNPPQSAILGMHNIIRRPVAIREEVIIRPIMYLALSYDHRIVDGKESVNFLVKVKEMLEEPTRLILGI